MPLIYLYNSVNLSFHAVKYIGRSDIETGSRLVLMAFQVVPPRLVNIDGFFCRLWYKGEPLIYNLCNVQGHKSADCPNRDKCRRCGESGHFARSCPNAWSSLRSSNATPASVVDFPPLPPAPRPSVGEPSSLALTLIILLMGPVTPFWMT